MRLLKTTNAFGISSYMPYSENAIQTIQDTNKYGTEIQRMTLQVVEVTMGKDEKGEWSVTSERLEETIFQLDKHKSMTPSKIVDKEMELAERQLELDKKEEQLRKLEKQLNKSKAKAHA